MSVSGLKSQGRKGDRRPNNAGRPSRQGYIHWDERNHRTNSPSSPEPGIKPSSRGGRMRGGNAEKNSTSEGIYANPRMMHAATSIVGCVVQVQVRNGAIYEGILKTFSSKMDIALEMAHKLDESQGSVPSRDRLIETVLFKLNDVIAISAPSVELDYANKDAFTDTAISKFNGQVTEKELQPWEADSPTDDSLETLEADGQSAPPFPRRGKVPGSLRRDKDTRSGTPPGRPGQGLSGHGRGGQNGWDANDMFKTNAEQFNVKSSYDPNLSQYTTPLKADNSKEFKVREARAIKLAHEIERSDAYRQRIELENGEGDEEEMFSAVVREHNAPANSTSGKLDMQHMVVQDRYVPPHMRKGAPPTRQVRQGGPRAKSPAAPNPPPATSPVARQPSPQQPETDKLNGDKEDKPSEMTAANEKGSEQANTAETKSEKEHSQNVGKPETRKRGRDPQIQELKDFSQTFKLSDNDPPSSSKDREKKGGSHSTSPQPSQQAASPAGSPQAQTQPTLQPSHGHPPSASLAEKLPQDAKKAESPDKKKSEIDMIAEKSTLNPLAKEFVYNPTVKPFTPKQQPMQVPTPPRPHTQSPVVMQHVQPGMGGQALYPSNIYVAPSMTGQQAVMQQQQQQQRLKRAVVSVQQRPDFNPGVQAAAAAATGQPLMANNMQQTPYVQYMTQSGVPQVRYSHQMMAMPGARMVGPGGLGQPGHDPGQVQGGQGQTVFGKISTYKVSPPGPQGIAGHLPHHHNAGPNQGHPAQPTHMAPHQQATPPHNQQPSHMNTQAGNHPAPSPVQHHQQHHPQHHTQQHQHHTTHHAPTQHQHHPGVAAAAAAAAAAGAQQPMPGHHPQGHPPNTNTPQPHLIYQPSTQISQQPHPPLQPSPHTPTSPQSMHPQQLSFAQPFSYTTQPGVQGGAQMSYAHNHPHTTVTHAQHQQHTHAPQIIMMQTQHQAQMAQSAGPPAHLQHGPPQAPLMQGPVHGQAGPHMVPQQTMSVSSGSMHPQQIHYMSHHPQLTSQHPPAMPAFQHSQ